LLGLGRNIFGPNAFCGPRKVHLALGVIRRDIDLDGADGLYAGRDRLEKSTADMATAERRLSEIKM
jgi:hypothetical protein